MRTRNKANIRGEKSSRVSWLKGCLRFWVEFTLKKVNSEREVRGLEWPLRLFWATLYCDNVSSVCVYTGFPPSTIWNPQWPTCTFLLAGVCSGLPLLCSTVWWHQLRHVSGWREGVSLLCPRPSDSHQWRLLAPGPTRRVPILPNRYSSFIQTYNVYVCSSPV